MESLEFETKVLNSRNASQMAKGEASAGNKLSHEIIDSEEQFKSLAINWRDLAKRAGATIFMTHEWALTWWKHFGRNKRRSLLIVTIWDEEKLVALAPFFKGFSSLGGLEIEKRLQIIGSGGSPNEQIGYKDDYGISDFLDILVDDNYTETVTEILSEIITSNRLEVDTITFHQTRNDSYIIQHLYPRLQKAGLNLTLEHTDTCPYIKLEEFESLKAFIKSKRSSARRRFRQSLKSISPKSDRGNLKLDELTTWPEVEKATETMIELHQERWNRIGFPGVFYDKRFTNFFRETVRYAFDNGWLWFKQIRDEEGVCAARLLLHYNGRYYDYISGFDETRDSSKHRPGITLLTEAVRDAIDGGAKTVELLRGQEGYKYDFTKKDFKNWKLSINSRERQKVSQKTVNRLTGVLALLYKRVTREARLINVQRLQNGFLKMLPGYISFRWNSMKMKMDN
ncbi:MAG: GNAT family N-acetyltransferase [Balneolaceae bacterium]